MTGLEPVIRGYRSSGMTHFQAVSQLDTSYGMTFNWACEEVVATRLFGTVRLDHLADDIVGMARSSYETAVQALVDELGFTHPFASEFVLDCDLYWESAK